MTQLEEYPLTVGGQHKITISHWQRRAYIYVRQSSLKQVRHNRESQANQYRLAHRAAALGWPEGQITIIDQDQGRSGRDSEGRDGFKELVGEVSLGRVGIIFGYEVSRLARNNRDWYHLLDLAALFDTLIADEDGIYDPSLYNDRLLLGLKGTMSEAELHILQQRLEAGRLNQIQQGTYRQHLPTGLVRLPDGEVIKEPDAQVRHSLELVFNKFVELGSGQQVLRYLVREGVLLPRRPVWGSQKGEIVWKPPTIGAIYSILHNPAYAGALAYGRRQSNPRHGLGGSQGPKVESKALPDWLHLQHDLYPAYISWDQYQANQARLAQNGTDFAAHMDQAQGAPREGAALLQGLALCGHCGARMRVEYKASHRYFCNALRLNLGQSICLSLHGPTIDDQVVAAFFEALRPAQLDILAALQADQKAERERQEGQWQERLKRAAYEAHLAQRQYNAVDPDNRLVAATLERRWEEALRQQQTTREAYQQFQQRSLQVALTPELQTQLQHLSEHLPDLWAGEHLSLSHKKELLRTLIKGVILKRPAPDTVEAKIVWLSGHYSVVTAQPPLNRQQNLTNYETMLARIKDLWQQGHDDPQIAATLTGEGFRSARATALSPNTVRKIRRDHGWRYRRPHNPEILAQEDWLTTGALATLLGVARSWIYRKLKKGHIDPQYVRRHGQKGLHLIRNDPNLITHLKQLLSGTLEQ
jgi:DNA invertase Pin-like site-specific DNA recombinase